jgi:hypothetical protein
MAGFPVTSSSLFLALAVRQRQPGFIFAHAL